MDELLAHEDIGRAVVEFLEEGKNEKRAKELLISKMIKPKDMRAAEFDELAANALVTVAIHVDRRTQPILAEWNNSISDPEFTPYPSGDLRMLAIKVLAALGDLRYLPRAAKDDQVDSFRKNKSPDGGLVWNRSRRKAESVEIVRFDSRIQGSLDTVLQLEKRMAFTQALERVRSRIKNSDRIEKARKRQESVFEHVIADHTLSNAAIARRLRNRGLRVSDDTVERDRKLIDLVLTEELKQLVSS